MGRWWQNLAPHLAALLLFALLPLLMTWPLASDLAHLFIQFGDPMLQVWTMAWDLHALLTDPAHIFNANIFYPYRNTLAYADHLFGQAALIVPVLLVSGNAILANNLSVLLALALSGFTMYLLVYDLTGSRLAGVVAGVAFASTPNRMVHIPHLNLVSAEFLPLAMPPAGRSGVTPCAGLSPWALS